MKLVDIHTHITPNVDDGSSNLEMSILMLKSIAEQGGTAVFLTPHSGYFGYGDSERIYRKMKMVREEAAAENIPLQIYEGCEIYSNRRNIEKNLRALRDGIIPSMNHTRYIMAEFNPYWGDMEDARFCLQQYLDKDWIPIIAHAERYCETFTTVENIRILKEMGCLVQINLFDLVQEPNRKILECARELLTAELVDMVGSDAHRMDHRKPELECGARYIREQCRPEYSDKILWKNAETLLCQ